MCADVDSGAPNMLDNPVGFKKSKAYVWHPDKKQDLPSTNQLVDEAMVAELLPEEMVFSMLSPDRLVEIVGGEKKQLIVLYS